MEQQLKLSQIKQNLSRLRFLKTAYNKSFSLEQSTKLGAHIIRIIKELSGTVQLYKIKKILGTSMASLLFLAGAQLKAQTFGAPIPIDSLALPEAIAPDLADVDGDGDLDVVHSAFLGYGIQTGYFENIGSAQEMKLDQVFRSLDLPLPSTGLIPPVSEMADLDNDGDIDFTATFYDYDTYETTIYFSENVGNGVFADFTITPIMGSDTLLLGVFDGNLLDIDDDGDLDLVTMGLDVGEYYNSGIEQFALTYVENTGTKEVAEWGAMTLIEDFPSILTEEEAPAIIELADFDQDGDLDVMLSRYFDYTNSIYELLYIENNGAAYADPVEIRLFEEQVGFAAITSGDIDGDGDTDVLFNEPDPEANSPINLFWLENLNMTSTEELSESSDSYALSTQLVANDLQLNYKQKQSSKFSMSIVTSNGAVISLEEVEPTSAIDSVNIAVSKLDAGNYYLVINDGQNSQALKFLKF